MTETALIGHDATLAHFKGLIQRDALHHAYLIVGPEHVGKQRLVEEISKVLAGQDGLYRDTISIDRAVDEKTGKTKKDISIDQIADLTQFLSRSSLQKDGYKIAIIAHADRLSTKAANALLKTLEEPRGKAVLFLLAVDDAAILPTIRSRVHQISLTRVSDVVIADWLRQHGNSNAERLARWSRGLPGLALTWHTQPETADAYAAEVHRFFSLFEAPFHKKRAMVESLFGDKSDPAETREQLGQLLALWQLLVRDLWLLGIDRSCMIHAVGHLHPYSRDVLRPIESAIRTARRYIEQNIHPRLLIEQILLHIP